MRPIKIMVVNGQSASAPDAHTQHVIEKTFREARQRDVDIITWCEVGDKSVSNLDGDFRTKQYGRPGQDDPEAGCAISWFPGDVLVGNFRRIVGSNATREGWRVTGAGIRERSMVRASLETEFWDDYITAIHAPPSRARWARLSYMRKALRLSGFIAGDTNFVFRLLCRLAPKRTIRSVGVLAFMAPKGYWVSKVTKVDVDSDHSAFIVSVEPARARKRRLKRKKP